MNGMLHIAQNRDAAYFVTYTPIGVPLSSCPTRSFRDRKELERFLAGPLRIDGREIAAALNALSRNGSYCVYEVRLSEAEIQEHGLGSTWSLSSSRAGLCYRAERFA